MMILVIYKRALCLAWHEANLENPNLSLNYVILDKLVSLWKSVSSPNKNNNTNSRMNRENVQKVQAVYMLTNTNVLQMWTYEKDV